MDPVGGRSPAIRAWSGVLGAELSVFPRHLGVVLPLGAVERMTIGSLMLVRAAASAAALQSAAKSPGTVAWEW